MKKIYIYIHNYISVSDFAQFIESIVEYCSFFRFRDRGPDLSCLAGWRNRSPREARAASGEKGKKYLLQHRISTT